MALDYRKCAQEIVDHIRLLHQEFLSVEGQPLARLIQAAVNDRQDRLRRLKGFTRLDRLHPVACLPVRKAAGKSQVIIPPVELHLPG